MEIQILSAENKYNYSNIKLAIKNLSNYKLYNYNGYQEFIEIIEKKRLYRN